MFQKRDGDVAILRRGGVYLQCPVYERHGFLYAKLGAGFVRLMASKSTSAPNATLDELYVTDDLVREKRSGALALAALVAEAHETVALSDRDRVAVLPAPEAA